MTIYMIFVENYEDTWVAGIYSTYQLALDNMCKLNTTDFNHASVKEVVVDKPFEYERIELGKK